MEPHLQKYADPFADHLEPIYTMKQQISLLNGHLQIIGRLLVDLKVFYKKYVFIFNKMFLY